MIPIVLFKQVLINSKISVLKEKLMDLELKVEIERQENKMVDIPKTMGLEWALATIVMLTFLLLI